MTSRARVAQVLSTSISSVAACHANRGVSQDDERETMTQGIFGRTSGDCVCTFDRDSSSWKRSQGSLFKGDLDERSPILLPQGMMQNGSIFPLAPSEHHTHERGCSLWPTPTSRDWKSGKSSKETMERNSRPLSEVVGGQLNPTWVEWLIGFPLGWTDSGPSATPSSHKSLK